MDDQRIGRVILILRQRRGWRQADLAVRSGVSESAISDMERGRVDRYTLATVRRVLRALDATAVLDVTWGGRGDLDRLLDADHARLVLSWADRHRRSGWDVWNEASFNIYGARGRIDQLALHPPPVSPRSPSARHASGMSRTRWGDWTSSCGWLDESPPSEAGGYGAWWAPL
jgi:Predicted transcriptional regulators